MHLLTKGPSAARSLGTAALVRAPASGLRRFSAGFVQQPPPEAEANTPVGSVIGFGAKE